MKIKCTNCNEIIEGDRKGTYITCKCGKVAIDETPYYWRIIGNEGDFEVVKDYEIVKEFNKIMNEKRTENGDIAYKSTGNNLVDIMFLTPYLEKNLNEVKIGDTEKEKILSMYIRDPRFGMGRRDLGRVLMEQAKVSSENIVKAGRYDDLYHIPIKANLDYLKEEVMKGNELAKKWLPRLTGKDKRYAKALCKYWNISEKEYRKIIKTEKTTEYKLSYAVEKEPSNGLEELFKNKYAHPLVDEIKFEEVPSLAMKKYLKLFSTRDDLKDRFNKYIEDVKEEKAKIHTTTANVYDAYKVATSSDLGTRDYKEAKEVFANKIVDNETLDLDVNAIVILDTSGSMGGFYGDMPRAGSNLEKAMSIAYAISIKSSYSPSQLISFSSKPKLMEIKGKTMKEKYKSMYTGDCSNTDFGKVMELLKGLKKFPKYLIVISDMEFDCGSNTSKKETMKLFNDLGVDTKIVWWNLNDRNKTVPEFDEYGNIYLSGYNIKMLKLLQTDFDMNTYIDKVLEDYKKKIDYKKE